MTERFSRSIALVTFDGRPPPPGSAFTSFPLPTSAPPPLVANSNEIGARKGVAVTRAGVKQSCVSGVQ